MDQEKSSTGAVTLISGRRDAILERVAQIERDADTVKTEADIRDLMAQTADALAYGTFIGEIMPRIRIVQFKLEEKLGHFLLATPRAAKGRPKIKCSTSEHLPTLPELGVDRKTSARAQQIAGLPEEVKEKVYAGQMKPAQALKEAKAKKPKKEKPEKVKPPKVIEVEPEDDLLDELKKNLQDAINDNQMMAKVFEADDQLKAAMDQVAQLTAENRQLRMRIEGLQGEKNAAIKAAKAAQNRLAKLEKGAK